MKNKKHTEITDPIEIERVMLACEGWFELGNSDEGLKELDSLEPRFQDHPGVLSWRCQFLEIKKRWEEILSISTKLCQIAPADIHGWTYPKDPVIPFHLAILHAYLKETADSSQWLQRSRNNKFFDFPHDDFVKRNRCTHKLLELLQTISN